MNVRFAALSYGAAFSGQLCHTATLMFVILNEVELHVVTERRALACDRIFPYYCNLFKALHFLEHVSKRRVNVTRSGFHFVHAQEHASHMSLDSRYVTEG
jgi:hypothetical protein